MNDRAVPPLRVDGKVPAHDLQPLPHTGQAEPVPPDRLLGIKAGARILDCQVDGVGVTAQRHVGASDPLCLRTF